MSLKTILKNIYSFLEVLQSARSEDVETWDLQSLNNAIQWATYCEQVYAQAEGKPYREDLNQQVKQLGRLPLRLGDLDINLELLSRATRVLIQSLVQNPGLSDELLCSILSHDKGEGSTTFDVLDILSEVSQVKTSLEQADHLHELINNTAEQIDDFRKSENIKAQASLLLRHVKKTLLNCHRKDKAESYLDDILSGFLKEQHGLDVVLTVLLTHDEHGSTAEGSSEVQQFVLQWLLKNCIEKGRTHPTQSWVKPFWHRVPSGLLCEVSAAYFSFYSAYMDHLTDRAKSMEICYDMKEKAGYTWSCRLSNAEDLSYAQLKQCFQDLCSLPHTAQAARKTIQSLAENSDCEINIWRDLLRDISDTYHIDQS